MLTDTKARQSKAKVKAYKLSDGGGLIMSLQRDIERSEQFLDDLCVLFDEYAKSLG